MIPITKVYYSITMSLHYTLVGYTLFKLIMRIKNSYDKIGVAVYILFL